MNHRVDTEDWRQANPAIGRTVDEEALRIAVADMIESDAAFAPLIRWAHDLADAPDGAQHREPCRDTTMYLKLGRIQIAVRLRPARPCGACQGYGWNHSKGTLDVRPAPPPATTAYPSARAALLSTSSPTATGGCASSTAACAAESRRSSPLEYRL